MARAACLVLLHPTQPLFAVCSRRSSNIDGLPGGKQDPGESMAEAAARETQEEVGVCVDDSTIQLLFADAIPGKKDFWVETFIAVSPTAELKQMEADITVKWTDWTAFGNNNAFKEYNDGAYRAWKNWFECQQLGKAYVFDASHFAVASNTPESPGF
jgi:8-oxo-dGTP pyrophosphatase MutT (NUDIX family)